MSEFVCFEAEGDNDVNLDDERLGEAETVSDTKFIDNAEYNEGVEDYYAFANVSREYDDAIGDSFADFDFSQGPNSYCSDDDICDEMIDEFKDSKKKVDEFKKTLIKPQGNEISILFLLKFPCRQVHFNRKVQSL